MHTLIRYDFLCYFHIHDEILSINFVFFNLQYQIHAILYDQKLKIKPQYYLKKKDFRVILKIPINKQILFYFF